MSHSRDSDQPHNPLLAQDGPRLLVSVRNAREAIATIEGGADIIDVKDPDQGPLGRASSERIRSIADAVNAQHRNSQHRNAQDGDPQLSAAMGEVVEFATGLTVTLPASVTLAKLGLSQLGSHANWVSIWRKAMASVRCEDQHQLRWVAVAYADEDAAGSPPWRDVLKHAVSDPSVCGMLFDTWSKSSGSLLDHRTVEELLEASDRLHASGRFLAVAGRLKTADLDRIRDQSIDIFAVRSAVCTDFDRQREVQPHLVSQLKADLTASQHSC